MPGESDARLVTLASVAPHPRNPRLIRRDRFDNLKRSLLADPGMMWLHPIGVQLATRFVYAGNQRWRAWRSIADEGRMPAEFSVDGQPAVPMLVEDLGDAETIERALRDNGEWGESVPETEAELLYELREAGRDVETLGFTAQQVAELLDSVGVETDHTRKRAAAEGDVRLSPELLERHDYLVFIVDNELDWRALCDEFGIGRVYEEDPETVRAGAQSANVGIGRVLMARELLAKLRGRSE